MLKKFLMVALSTAIIFTTLFSLTLFVSANETGQWSTVATGTGDTTAPVIVETGVQGSNAGYYPSNNSGTHFNQPLDLKDFSFDVKIDKLVSSGEGVDAWIGPCILNKNAYFDVADASKGAGLVTLIRPKPDGSADISMMGLLPDESFATHSATASVASFKENTTYHFAYKLTDEGLECYLDDTRLATIDWLKDVYPNGIGYFTFSASDNQTQNGSVVSKWTLLKMNGEDAATYVSNAVDNGSDTSDTGSTVTETTTYTDDWDTYAPTEAPTEAPSENDSEGSNTKTGVSTMAVIIIVLIVIAALFTGVIFISKRKTGK